jgi:hypothetical protein
MLFQEDMIRTLCPKKSAHCFFLARTSVIIRKKFGEIKENGRGGEFRYYWYIVRTFVNATCTPSTTIKKF